MDPDRLYGQEHVERYRATDGEEGHDWKGTQTLIITTTGHRSGEPRSTPVIYTRHGDDYVVIPSRGGSDEPPGWYRNLKANPEAQVQVWGDRFTARAREATPEEKPELWRQMTSEWPAYDDYQAKTDREIPVVLLERVG